MSTGLHKDLATGEIHTVVAYVYADETARLAATGFVAADLYKMAYQISTGTLWVLQSYSPITWSELASGSSPQLNKVEVTILKNTSGTLAVGKAIHVVSWDIVNDLAKCELAQANSPSTAPCAGIVSVAATDAASGKAMLLGVIRNTDTSGMVGLAPTYLSATVAGDVVTTPPSGPYIVQALGQCLRSNAVDGVLGVNILSYRAIKYSTPPNPLGVAAAGVSNEASASDHVHLLPKLDDLNAPDDNTDLDSTTSAHGLLPKLPNDSNKFINGVGDWGIPDYTVLAVRNETGVALAKGKAVYTSGWSVVHNCPLVALADKDDPVKRPAYGIVREQINDVSNGIIIIQGILDGLNTTAYSITDQIVLGSNGALSRPPPDEDPFTGEVQNLGWVAKVDATVGSIYVNVDGLIPMPAAQVFILYSSELGKTVDPTVNDDVTLGYKPGSRWINTTLDKEFVCLDNSDGAAVWIETTGSGAPLASTAPADVTKAAAAVGVGTTAARADHKHDITTAAPGATGVATASGDGSATTLARSDHTHQSNSAPVAVTKATAAIGTSGQPARADHKHDVTTAVASAQVPGDSAAEGSATSLARSDHKHGLPAYGTGSGTICQGNDARLSDARTPTGSAGGDLTGSTYPNPTVAAAAITNAKLANMAQALIKGRAAGAGTGAPVDLTATQATAILDAFTSALKGLAPASGGGTTNYLRADGTWAAPPGSGSTFGGNFQQGSSDGESSTTSGTYQQKLRITTASLPAGTYRIGFYFEWNKSGLTDAAVRVQVNDTTTCMGMFEEAADAGSDQWYVRGGYYYYVAAGGVLNIDLDYHAGTSDTVIIRRARLEIWRVS